VSVALTQQTLMNREWGECCLWLFCSYLSVFCSYLSVFCSFYLGSRARPRAWARLRPASPEGERRAGEGREGKQHKRNNMHAM